MNLLIQAVMIVGLLVGTSLLAAGVTGLIKRRPFTARPRQHALNLGVLSGVLGVVWYLKEWNAQRPHDFDSAAAFGITSIILLAASRALSQLVIVHLPRDLMLFRATDVPVERLKQNADAASRDAADVVPKPMMGRQIWPGLAQITPSTPRFGESSPRETVERLLSSLPLGTGKTYVALDICVGLMLATCAILLVLLG